MKMLTKLVILFSVATVLAQSSNKNPNIGEKFIDDAKIFFDDGISFFTAPMRFSTTDWLYTAGTAGGTYLLIHSDEEIRSRIGRNTIKTLNGDFWDIPTKYAYIAYANVFSLSTYAAGLFTGEDEVRKVGRLMFESISYSGIMVMAARILTGRERPYSGKGPWKWTGATLDNEVQSFPSGHTTVAFALSTVLAEYFDTIWSRLGFYGLAGLTAYARLLNNQHWFSDVVVGALFGILSGTHVMSQEYKRIEDGDTSSNFIITPTINGISFAYKLN